MATAKPKLRIAYHARGPVEYLTDHCNREGETLISVQVSPGETQHEMWHMVKQAFLECDAVPEEFGDDEIRAVMVETFGEPDLLPEHEVSAHEDTCWYRITWHAEEPKPVNAYERAWSVDGEHWYQHGNPRTLHASKAGAYRRAAELLNVMLKERGLTPVAAEPTEAELSTARDALQADLSEYLGDDYSEAYGVWVNEFELQE